MKHASSEYAIALFSLASEQNVYREVAASARIIHELICENRAYIELLAAPTIPIEERCAMVEEAFGGLHEYAVSLVKLLCERGDIHELLEVLREYMRLYEHAEGIVTAEIISAIPLTKKEIAALTKKLEAKLSRKVKAVTSVDAAMLGGVIVRVEGKVIDGSLRHRLSEIKETIGK